MGRFGDVFVNLFASGVVKQDVFVNLFVWGVGKFWLICSLVVHQPANSKVWISSSGRSTK